MAGQGPPPKDVAVRRRRNQPARGEWIDLPEPSSGVPDMPEKAGADGGWSQAAASSWTAWWCDPASTQWGPGDLVALLELLALTEVFWTRDHSVANEMRLRATALGLTPAGKRALRWRVPMIEAGADDEDTPSADPYASLTKRALDEAVEADR